MKFLFYLVHPAKFQFHKEQIKELKKRGHEVDILINTKDVLEDLLIEEGLEYTNIFPEGRKIKGLHVYFAAFISIFKTLKRLLSFTKGKKYDLFIGDLLTILGKIKRTPSIYATDDVIRQVPEQSIFLLTCTHIIAPKVTELGIFNKKKNLL
jgi:predicted glycosyltransferase